MPDPVKRPYRSERRGEQARETRRQVLEAARQTFVERGYGRATIRAIAERAGVSPETLYATFGNKRSLLAEAMTAAVRGLEEEAILEQSAPRALEAAHDAGEKLAIFSRDVSLRLERAAPLMEVLVTAARQEPELARLRTGMHDRRLQTLRTVAESLDSTGALAPTVEDAARTVWALTSPELYNLLTEVGGWTREQYAEWLRAGLSRLLLRS